ncbi:glycosyltransferase [Alteromonas macleodii]|uniref:glycosyltransferase n=1 Tax=Alteromonas macleodii TaxID=28108 RepID=UPI00313B14B0
MNSKIDVSTSFQKVSVLVPVYNDVDRIGKCISYLLNLNYPKDLYEVIVIDNGSTDGTYEYLSNLISQKKEKTFRLLQCLTPGSYAARNAGLEVASGDCIAFTDSDCLVSENWLLNLMTSWHQEEGDVIVAGKVSFFSDSAKRTQQSALDFENMFSMKQDQNAKNGKCITANLFCSLDLLRKHGGFNEKLKSGGDVAFSQRIVESGGKVVYSEKSEVLHPSRNKNELLVKRRRVVGGMWDLELAEAGLVRKSRFCANLVKMFFIRASQACIKSRLSPKRKAGLIWLLFLIFLTSMTEFLQLQLGKEANRT